MRPILALLLVLGACAAPAARNAAAPATDRAAVAVSPAEQVVQTQLEAYNRRDIDAFAATYAADVKIYDHPAELMMSGVDKLRENYGRFFASAPNLRATVTQRIVQGEYVIDYETVTGLPDGVPMRAVAVYQVRNGRIQNIWFID